MTEEFQNIHAKYSWIYLHLFSTLFFYGHVLYCLDNSVYDILKAVQISEINMYRQIYN